MQEVFKKWLKKQQSNLKKERLIYIGVLLLIFIIFFYSEKQDYQAAKEKTSLNSMNEFSQLQSQQYVEESVVRNRIIGTFISYLVQRQYDNILDLFDQSIVEHLFTGGVEDHQQLIEDFGKSLTRDNLLYDAAPTSVNEQYTIYTIKLNFLDGKESEINIHFNPQTNQIATVPELLTEQLEDNLKDEVN